MTIKHDDFYVVKCGECIDDIAFQAGFAWDKIWNHPSNRQVKKNCPDPNVIAAGIEVYIPEIEKKQAQAGTGKKSSFVRRSFLTAVVVEFTVGGMPRKGEAYVMKTKQGSFSGELDDSGCMEVYLEPYIKEATVRFEDGDEIKLMIGGLEPSASVKGVQQRLNNLGIFAGEEDGDEGPLTKEAISLFQKDYKDEFDLVVNGELDDDTVEALQEVYGG